MAAPWSRAVATSGRWVRMSPPKASVISTGGGPVVGGGGAEVVAAVDDASPVATGVVATTVGSRWSAAPGEAVPWLQPVAAASTAAATTAAATTVTTRRRPLPVLAIDGRSD